MENFLLIAVFVTLGIISRKLEAFPPETVKVLNMFALYVSLPAVILLKVPQITFSTEVPAPVLTAWRALFGLGLLISFATLPLFYWLTQF